MTQRNFTAVFSTYTLARQHTPRLMIRENQFKYHFNVLYVFYVLSFRQQCYNWKVRKEDERQDGEKNDKSFFSQNIHSFVHPFANDISGMIKLQTQNYLYLNTAGSKGTIIKLKRKEYSFFLYVFWFCEAKPKHQWNSYNSFGSAWLKILWVEFSIFFIHIGPRVLLLVHVALRIRTAIHS